MFHLDVFISRFCEECLGPYLDVASPNCPLCREVFDPKQKAKAKDLEKQISAVKTICQGCKKKVSFDGFQIELFGRFF